MPEPALVAGATEDGRIYDYQISRFETRYLFPNVRYDRTALMTNAKREMHNLVTDPSLCVIVEI
jgi:hypothetical protein